MTKNISNHNIDIMTDKYPENNLSIVSFKNGLKAICTIGIASSLLEFFSGLACVGGGLYAMVTETILSLISAESLLVIGCSLLALGLFNMIKNLLGLKGADYPDKIIPALVMGAISMVLSGWNLINGLAEHLELFPVVIMTGTLFINIGFFLCSVMILAANKTSNTGTK